MDHAWNRIAERTVRTFMRRIFLLLPVAAAIAGCQGARSNSQDPKLESARLEKNQAVELMLLAPIESGDCPKGMIVDLAVAKDVVSRDGTVILPVGTHMTGEITWSRAAGAVSALINQPARLAMRVRPTRLATGEELKWIADPDAKEPEEFEFTLENVGGNTVAPQVESALADARKKALLEELSRAIESGAASEELEKLLSEDPTVGGLMGELGYAKANEFMANGKEAERGFRRLLNSANDLRSGNLGALSSGELSLAMAAIEEIGGLANQVTGVLKGIFKGRNIRAKVGQRLTVYASDAVDVRLPVKIEP